DPAKAYLNACAANGYSLGEAACDPQSCQIITNLAQCAVCGDGKAEQGEDCDRGVDPVQYCPDGSTKADCNDDTCLADFSVCPSCQNGIVDAGEECDPVEPCRGLAADEHNCDGEGPPILS